MPGSLDGVILIRFAAPPSLHACLKIVAPSPSMCSLNWIPPPVTFVRRPYQEAAHSRSFFR
jgi:hypothetical protein